MFNVSSNYPLLFPARIIAGIFITDGEEGYNILSSNSNSNEWGCPNQLYQSYTSNKFPIMIDMIWLSIVEEKFYSITNHLPTTIANHFLEDNLFDYLVVGIAPYGKIAIWGHGNQKAELLSWMEGDEINVDKESVYPLHYDETLHEICQSYINDNEVNSYLAANGLPPRDLFDNYMKQFTYRYLPLFEHWDEDEEKWQPYTEEEQETQPELDYIEEALYDGTHDKLHDGGLIQYHEAGKPKKLAVKWHIKKSEYMAYFWFEDEAIRTIFDKFYGIHPDTKTDFVIHIDPEKKKYELALYRYGMNEPKPISEDAYQLIVFKNKFEQYRSKNYDQPRGAWIW